MATGAHKLSPMGKAYLEIKASLAEIALLKAAITEFFWPPRGSINKL